MLIYILNLLLIVVLRILIKDKKKYVAIVSIQLFLVLACRDSLLGVDLSNYVSGYKYISSLRFIDVIRKIHLLSTADLIYPFSYESGYMLLNWIISKLGLNFHGFLVVCALFNIYTFAYFIYKYSKIPWISFFILCTFGTYTYFFGILRHSIALCLFLWSLESYIKNKKICSYALFLFAFMNHRSVISLFPLLLLLKKQKLTKKKFFFIILSYIPYFLLSKFIYSNVVLKFMEFFGKSYVGNGFQINNLIILLLIIAIFILFFANFDRINDDVFIRISLFALILSIYFEIIGMYNDNFARLVQMFNAFLMFLIPSVIYTYNKQKSILLVKVAMIIMLTVFYIGTIKNSNIVPYKIENENFLIG